MIAKEYFLPESNFVISAGKMFKSRFFAIAFDAATLHISSERSVPSIVQAEQMNTTTDDYSFRLEYINSNGNKEKIYNAISYNPFLQQMHGNWKFEEYDQEGNIIGERIRPLLMRQTYRSEIFLLAELCGFEVLDIYRGYLGDKEDLSDPMSAAKYRSNLIWILKKK